MRPTKKDGQEFGLGALENLLGGDEERLLRILRAFQQVAGDNLVQLDSALRSGDVAMLRTVAQQAATACHLVGEDHAGFMLQGIVDAASRPVVDPILMRQVIKARTALRGSVLRITVRINEQRGIKAPPA